MALIQLEISLPKFIENLAVWGSDKHFSFDGYKTLYDHIGEEAENSNKPYPFYPLVILEQFYEFENLDALVDCFLTKEELEGKEPLEAMNERGLVIPFKNSDRVLYRCD